MAKKNQFVIAKFPALKSIYCTLGISHLRRSRQFLHLGGEIQRHLRGVFLATAKKALLFIILLFLLFASLWPRTGFQKAAWEVGKWPNNPHLHLALAKEYAQVHHFNLVQKEVSQANSLNPLSLYENKAMLEKIFAEKIKKQEIEKEIKRWEEILKEYPGFRDVYLRLSLLYWQLYDNLMADTYLKNASRLSPNYSTVLQFQQFFRENLP